MQQNSEPPQTEVSAWLKAHPEAKDEALRSFGISGAAIADAILAEPPRAMVLAKALSNSAITFQAPSGVMEELNAFEESIRSGLAILDHHGSFVQKTLAQLVGLRDTYEMEMILRDAFPHAPNNENREFIKNLMEFLKRLGERDPKIPTGDGEVPCVLCCLAGCVLCAEVNCPVCCMVLCGVCG